MKKLAACLLNISEAQNFSRIEQIAKAAISLNYRERKSKEICSTVLNIFADKIYNRSVITIAGTLDGVVDSVTSACRKAFEILDSIENHKGGHPRKGTVDLIPIHPITEETSLEDCAEVSFRICENLKSSHAQLVDIFFFGHSDLPLKRSLVAQRKNVDWFKMETTSLKFHGLTGIGATPYMSNCNVTINIPDIQKGALIANSIRERSGGLLCVQSMAFLRGGSLVEIACNVDTIEFDDQNKTHLQELNKGNLTKVFGNFYSPPFQVIIDRIADEAKAYNGHVEESTIIGYSAFQAGHVTKENLQRGISWAVKPEVSHM